MFETQKMVTSDTSADDFCASLCCSTCGGALFIGPSALSIRAPHGRHSAFSVGDWGSLLSMASVNSWPRDSLVNLIVALLEVASRGGEMMSAGLAVECWHDFGCLLHCRRVLFVRKCFLQRD